MCEYDVTDVTDVTPSGTFNVVTYLGETVTTYIPGSNRKPRPTLNFLFNIETVTCYIHSIVHT